MTKQIDTAFSVTNEERQKMTCVGYVPSATSTACGQPATVYIEGTGFGWCTDHEEEAIEIRDRVAPNHKIVRIVRPNYEDDAELQALVDRINAMPIPSIKPSQIKTSGITDAGRQSKEWQIFQALMARREPLPGNALDSPALLTMLKGASYNFQKYQRIMRDYEKAARKPSFEDAAHFEWYSTRLTVVQNRFLAAVAREVGARLDTDLAAHQVGGAK